MILKLIKNVLVFFSLFYLTFYLPFMFVAYNPYWINYNCENNRRCSKVKTEFRVKAVDELTSFLSHRGELKTGWQKNEKIHMGEVRHIFDIMAAAALVSLAVLLIIKRGRMSLYKFAIINIVIALALFLIVPNFKSFWRDVFHPLLFNNDFWKMSRQDVSYYITPRSFFKLTTIVVLSTWVFLNVLIVAAGLIFRKDRSQYLD